MRKILARLSLERQVLTAFVPLAARLSYYQAISGDVLACLPLQLKLRGKSTHPKPSLSHLLRGFNST